MGAFQTTSLVENKLADEAYDAAEQDVVVRTFADMLWAVTKDGGKKRAAGTKPPWWCDDGHPEALWRHLWRWRDGEKVDPDSGAHPLVHMAWRALAIAYQEIHGEVDPT